MPNTEQGNDLISREELMDRVRGCDLLEHNGILYVSIENLEASLNETPFASPAPVIHAQWLVDDCDGGDPGCYAAFIEVHCSNCGYALGAENGQYDWYYGEPFPMNFCPHCGAQMEQKA